MTSEGNLERLKGICRIGGAAMLVLIVVTAACTVLMLCALVVSVLDPGMVEGIARDLGDGTSADGLTLQFLSGVLQFAALTVTFWILHGLMRDISREYSPFTQANVRRFRLLAIVFLVLPALLLALYLASPESFDGVPGLMAACLVAALVFYSISLVFRYGAFLQKESNETL